MARYELSTTADARLDEIYLSTRERWGDEQATSYVQGLFDCFDDIASKRFPWRAVAPEFGIEGYYRRCEHHFIYWREWADGTVGIVTVLHERMHQLDRFRDDL